MSPWLPKAGEQNYCHERGVLRQPRLVLSQFWRPEVQGQGESGLWFSLEALRRICSLPSPDLIFFWSSLTGSFIALTFACLYTSFPPPLCSWQLFLYLRSTLIQDHLIFGQLPWSPSTETPEWLQFEVLVDMDLGQVTNIHPTADRSPGINRHTVSRRNDRGTCLLPGIQVWIPSSHGLINCPL